MKLSLSDFLVGCISSAIASVFALYMFNQSPHMQELKAQAAACAASSPQ